MMLETLKKYFGYDSFRPQQEEIIKNVIAGNDTLVLMPTGGGKSICYQMPALLTSGTAVVVSPLISLMKDQVEALLQNGIPAGALNSNQSENNSATLRNQCISGKIKLLYISPERLMNEMDYLLHDMQISLFAIDEAHCVSQWGHDFRPEYTQMGIIHEKFPDVPIVALTATADKITREDIVNQLKLNNPQIYISSFDRPNLSLTVKRGYMKKEKDKSIVKFINQHAGDSGIIYCLSRKTTESVADMLVKNGIPAKVYHAGLSPMQRDETQTDFINDRVQIICATIAFGMGIDKSNVRWVIHYNMPKSMESYYQEIGRAGRDGLPSDTVLFYSMGDIVLLRKFAEMSGQSDINMEKLRRMQQYAEADICRRRILLSYFGENMDHNCNNCDVCQNPPEQFDGTVIVQKALSAIVRAEENISIRLLVDILKGFNNIDVISKGYDHLKTYGAGRDVPTKDWYDYLLQMLQIGYFEIAYNEGNHLKVTESGKKILFGSEHVKLVTIKREEAPTQKKKTVQKPIFSELPDEKRLFEELRMLRLNLAKQFAIPPYLIFSDSTLHDICKKRPKTIGDFAEVNGVGDYKLEKYGKDFIKIIKKFVD
jgi:ATP-dependent DNA helicase RecQ